MWFLSLISLFLLVVLGCVKMDYTSRVGVEYTSRVGQEFAPKNADSIVVYESEDEFLATKRAYDIIGDVNAKGSQWKSRTSMRKEIVDTAAKKGADAVIFVYVPDEAPTSGSKWYAMPQIGSLAFDRSKPGGKRVKAFLIRFK